MIVGLIWNHLKFKYMSKSKKNLTEIECSECGKFLTKQEYQTRLQNNTPEDEMICNKCMKEYAEDFYSNEEF